MTAPEVKGKQAEVRHCVNCRSKDPLRAMLRPEVEDQMVDVIARTITDLEFGDGAWDRIHEGWKGPPRRHARAVLMVMRGIAGG